MDRLICRRLGGRCIGENSAVIRLRICEGLGFLGVALDEAPNTAGASVISKEHSGVTVRVIHTNEESQIARSVLDLLAKEQGQ